MNRQKKFQQLLEEQYLKRAQNYIKYSNRAFAQYIGIDAPTLHKIRTGERSIGPKLITRVAKKLGLTQEEINALIEDDQT